MPKISGEDLDWMRDYINAHFWKPAKRGPNHFYTVRDWFPEEIPDFNKFVNLIRAYGHPENFYSQVYIYFYIDEYKYWTMGSPIPETEVINRAPIDTFYGKQTMLPPNPELEETVYDKLAAVYDERYSDMFYLEENGMLFTMLAPFTVGRILDIGCGTGIFLDYLDISPFNYLGLDPSLGMLNEFYRKHKDFAFWQGTFEEYESPIIADLAISLFGSPSYIDPSSYFKMTTITDKYFYMFYKEGYLPDYYPTRIDYPHINLVFERTFIFNNYLVATNLPGVGL